MAPLWVDGLNGGRGALVPLSLSPSDIHSPLADGETQLSPIFFSCLPHPTPSVRTNGENGS